MTSESGEQPGFSPSAETSNTNSSDSSTHLENQTEVQSAQEAPSIWDTASSLVEAGKTAREAGNAEAERDINEQIMSDPDLQGMVTNYEDRPKIVDTLPEVIQEKPQENVIINEVDSNQTETVQRDFSQGLDYLVHGDPDYIKTDQLSPSEESRLRNSLDRQFHEPLEFTESDEDQELVKTFGVHGSARSLESTVFIGTRKRGEQYFQILKEVYEKVRVEKGLPEIDMDRVARHELEHFEGQVKHGFDTEKTSFTVGYAHIMRADGSKYNYFDLGISKDFRKEQEMPLEAAEIDLAPQDPSPKDIRMFLDKYQRNKKLFLRPKNILRTFKLFRKLKSVTNWNMFQMTKLFFS